MSSSARARRRAGGGGAKGKAKRQGSRSVKAKGRGGDAAGAGPPPLDAALDEAQMQMAFGNYDKALAILAGLYARAPDNLAVVETYGSSLAEAGQTSLAAQVLRAAVALSPEAGHEKYMYLSQCLGEGDESVAWARKGVTLLRAAAAAGDANAREPLCQALCALAELLLARLGEGGAVAEAVASDAMPLLLEAEHADPASPEPALVIASLCVELGKAEEARVALRRSMAVWRRQGADADDADANNDGGGADDAMVDGDAAATPSYEFRFETAKLALELEEGTETAVDILESLLCEDDANLDVWFLLAIAHHGGGQWDDAEACLDRAAALIAAAGIPADGAESVSLETLRGDVRAARREAEAEAEEDGGDGMGVDG